MKRLLLIVPLATVVLVGCNSGPRDATNDPEVQAMLKGVNEQGKMPGKNGPVTATPTGGATGAAPAPAPGGSPAPAPGK